MQNQLNIVQIGNDQSEDDRLVQLSTSRGSSGLGYTRAPF